MIKHNRPAPGALTFFAVLLLASCLRATASDGLETLWTAGKPNGGYMEFSPFPAKQSMTDYAEKYSAGFHLKATGKNARGEFPGIQAGPADSWGGFRTHPLEVRFKPAAATGGFVLTVGVVSAAPGAGATLEASLNGHAVSAEVAPDTDDKALYLAAGGLSEPREALFYFPPEAARTGENTLTMTVTRGSWLLYDFARLERVVVVSRAIIKNFKAEAPPFLARLGNGTGHAVRMNFFAVGGPVDGALVVSSGGKEYRKPITVLPGPNTSEIVVPEQRAESTAAARLEIGGEPAASAETALKPVKHVTITLIPHSHLDIGYPDLQPNIMIDQKHYLERALDLIETPKAEPMKWVAEIAWHQWNLIKGIGPFEEYGQWLGDSPLTAGIPEEFWKETMNMRSVASVARLTASSLPNDGLNMRRLVDGSPMGWQSQGPGKGAWIEFEFAAPQKFRYAAIRGGRETANTVRSLVVSFSRPGGAANTYPVGPMGANRERLLLPVDETATRVRVEILDAERPAEAISLMEVELWTDDPLDAQVKRLERAVRDGRVEITAMYMNFLTQLIPTELLIRSMLRSDAAAARLGGKLETAMMTDVPGFSFAIPDVLAGAGIRYFYPALNPDHAWTCLNGMPRAFHWEGPGGGRVLVYHSFDSYMEGWRAGFSIGADAVERELPTLLRKLDEEEYPYDILPLRMLGDITDDGPVPELLPEVVEEWNRRWAYPKAVIGVPSEFFREFDKRYASKLPLLKGDWTGYWEDGAASSAMETIEVREAHREFITATAFDAVWKQITGKTALGPEKERVEEQLYHYDEHTWGADVSVSDPEGAQALAQWLFKKMPAMDVFLRADELLEKLSPLAVRFAPKPSHGGKIFAVLNPTGAARTGYVELKASNPTNTRETNYSIYDVETGAVSMPTYVNPWSECEDGNCKRWIIIDFFAENIPPMGIRYYEVVPSGSFQSVAKEIEVREEFLSFVTENKFYRFSINKLTGQITSVFDKELNRELVDGSGGFGMNEFLHVKKDNENPTRVTNVKITADTTNSSSADFCISGEGAFESLIIQCARPDNSIKRIKFFNTFDKNLTYEKEGGYFAFPFNVPGGEMRLETTGGVVALEKDQLPGAARDWISVQDAVAVVSPEYSVMLSTPDAPMVVPGKIEVMNFRRNNDPAATTLFSYVFNNYWHTNYLAGQGGTLEFHYMLTSTPGRAPDSEIIKFGAEEAIPMRAIEIDTEAVDQSQSKGGAVSFLAVEPASVRLLGVKSAEDGRGMVVRLQEMDGKGGGVKLRVNKLLGVSNASSSNLLERDERPLRIEKDGEDLIVDGIIPPKGLLTIRIW